MRPGRAISSTARLAGAERRSCVTRVSDDKVIIKRGMDGHYVYFSVRDDRDNGSIIDFVQFRQGSEPRRGAEGIAALDRSSLRCRFPLSLRSTKPKRTG